MSLSFHSSIWNLGDGSPILPHPSCWLCPAPLSCDSQTFYTHTPPTFYTFVVTSLSSPFLFHQSPAGSHPVIREPLYIHSFRLLAASTPVPSGSILPGLRTLSTLLHLLKCSSAFQTWIPDTICDTPLILSRQKVLCA